MTNHPEEKKKMGRGRPNKLRPLHRITDAMTYDLIVSLTISGRGRPPSINSLAEALGTVKSNAYAHVRKLEKAGIVERLGGGHGITLVGSVWVPPAYPEMFDSLGLIPKGSLKENDEQPAAAD